jgi:hypothetical protein
MNGKYKYNIFRRKKADLYTEVCLEDSGGWTFWVIKSLKQAIMQRVASYDQ